MKCFDIKMTVPPYLCTGNVDVKTALHRAGAEY